jgi:ubiquitin C-terminal hydrolase
MSSTKVKGLVGLTNIGNTCYGNAALQALRHQVDLTIYILQGQHLKLMENKPKTDKTRMMESYGELVRALWTKEEGAVSTKPFWSAMIPVAMKEGFEQFRVPIPHDAHEFLVFILDQIHEALSEKVTMTIRPPLENTQKTRDAASALGFWKSAFEKSYSPMVDLLFGLLRKSVTCEVCKNESVTWETMNIHKVCAPKQADRPVGLLDLMREECKGETIDEYACDHCIASAAAALAKQAADAAANAKQAEAAEPADDEKQEKPAPVRTKANKTLSYWRLGNWVIVTLKRNENNGRKINTIIDIPKKIEFGELFHPNSEEASAKASYELFSTIEHHGSSGGGHYTSHAKHSVTEKWTFYDDESGIEVPDVRINNSTYVVMYRKATPSSLAASPAASSINEMD